MRSRTFSAVGVGVAALVLAGALAPVASANGASQGTSRPTLSAGPAKHHKTCYTNMNAHNLTGVDIPSTNYDDQNSTRANQAADDFTLTQPCVLREVDVAGNFDQTTQLDWENVYIFPDDGGMPGMPAIWVQSALDGKQGHQPGDFKIRFGPLALQPGTYWISVQAQVQSGQWGWDNIDKASGSSAVFQNPGGVFPGCPTWTPIQTCFPGTPAPDLAFRIKS